MPQKQEKLTHSCTLHSQTLRAVQLRAVKCISLKWLVQCSAVQEAPQCSAVVNYTYPDTDPVGLVVWTGGCTALQHTAPLHCIALH